MTVETKRAKIIEKVKALLARTTENGCTESEALEAAKKVGVLMDEHNLSMSEIEVRAEAQHCETDYYDTRKTRNNPGVYMLHGVDKLFGVKSWISHHRSGIRYAIFGMPADVAAAKYLMTVLVTTMEREATTYLKQHGGGRTAGTTFRAAFAERIAARLREMARERETVGNRSTIGTALVDLKNQLVEEKYHDIAKTLGRPSYNPSAGQFDARAAAAGFAAGERASLHRGVGHEDHGRRAIPA